MKKLFFDEKKVREICGKYPTPFYLYDEKGIREGIRILQKAFSWNKGYKEYFAVKACPNPYLVKLITDEGCGVDCSSYTELMLSEALGLSGDHIMFSSNATPAQDFRYARELNAIINLDDITHIDFLAENGGIPETVCLRYNPGGDFKVGNAIMGNPGDAKYGLTRVQMTEAIRKLMGMGVKNFGVHAFLASNMIEKDYYGSLASILFRTVVELNAETGAHFTFVNLSGGIGIPYRPEETAPDLLYVGETVRKAYEEIIVPSPIKEISLKTELGRYITGPHGVLVATAIHRKDTYKHYIGLDACAANLMRPAIYGAYHHITVMGKENAPCDHVYDITGGLCENNDKFAVDRALPEIEIGDMIAIHDAGAHGFAMGYNYNGKLRSSELLLKEDGSVEMIRRAETPADYFATFDFSGILDDIIQKGGRQMANAEHIAKVFEPQQIEKRIYDTWEKKGYFRGVVDKAKKPFTIVIPPPNITGQLHMGHAMDNTMQDIIIRFKRMQGFAALWLPGTDHASIATEAKIVDAMASEGLTKEDLGREKFLERAWEWKKLYGGRIVEQLKRLGSSCDWDRERFTMDEGLSNAVLEVFVSLYQKGLIYKGERITNWCPKCNTSISDIEVEYEEQDGSFWHINYPLADGSGVLTIATTRPETLLGDTAVAVNPGDEKYQGLIGKMLILPLVNKEIPIIADDYVELGFGTGAVKITPAHDPNDFEVGKRHNLPVVRIMDDRGIINENGGKYAGMDRYEARKAIVADLEAAGLLVKTEPHKHNVGTCQRCHTTVEPFISKQWYVKMKPLAEPAIEAVRSGEVRFVPERFSKIYFNWMENIQDWCISRQLWWGHRIPAYYCQDCGHMEVAKDAVTVCPKCGSTKMEQDPDTLDTWFSSALWPFSTLGWPEKTEDLDFFYPTNVLVTGYDIIFFWVARMIFSGIEQMKEPPFRHVLIHGLVRDAQGRKMSKSLGNGIDPLKVIDEYGTDALRFALITGNSPGNDQRFLPEKCEAARNFANKVWNATRFVLMNFDENPDFAKVNPEKFTAADKWILSGVNNLVREVTENLNKYELGVALSKVYDFIWDYYCDWYIELVKPRLFDSENPSRLEAQYVLNEVLVKCLKLLHPFMPFVTEELYQNLYKDSESIMISQWPVFDEQLCYDKEARDMGLIIDAIRAVRGIRTEMNVPVSKKAQILFVTDDARRAVFEEAEPYFIRLASATGIQVQTAKDGIPEDAAAAAVNGAEIFIPLEELIDFEKEIARLEKEKANLEGELKRVEGKLSNQGFLAKAPEAVVAEEKEKQEKYTAMHRSVSERLDAIRKKL